MRNYHAIGAQRQYAGQRSGVPWKLSNVSFGNDGADVAIDHHNDDVADDATANRKQSESNKSKYNCDTKYWWKIWW